MGSRKRNKGLQLKFGTITCERCGGERLLARECPECGAGPKPQEVQYDLQRRERVVAEFRSRRKSPNRTVFPDVDHLGVDFDIILRRVQRSLADVSRADRTADSLLSSFERLDQLVASWNNPLLRPGRNRGRIIGDALEMFREGIEMFVDALVATDLHAAQDFARRGNLKIAEAGTILDRTGELDAAEESLSGLSVIESLNRVGRAARQGAHDRFSVTELDGKLASGVGWEVGAAGLGLQAHTIQLMALSSFDVEMFTRIVTISDVAASAGGEELAASDDWKRGHARAAAFLGSAMASVDQAIAADDGNDLEVAHRLVQAVATWRDGVLKHSLATLLASSVGEYQKLASMKGGEVIRRATAAHPGLLLDENLTQALRNAGGHADIDVNQDAVMIGKDSFTFDEFVDRILAYLETTVATFVGTTTALVRHGADFTYSEYLAPRDRDAAVALFLGMYGLTCDAVEVRGESLTIHATGPDPDWMALGAALSAMFPESISVASIILLTEAGDRRFSTSLDRYRKYAGGLASLEVEEAALGFSAIVAASRLDGGSPWVDEDWGRVVKAVTARNEEVDLRAWVKNVRQLRGYGREAEQVRVVSACEGALAALRR